MTRKFVGILLACMALKAQSDSWTNLYSKLPDGSGYGSEVAIDSRGDVVVGGGHTIVKYSSGGVLKWVALQDAEIDSVAVDASNKVFAIGVQDSASSTDIMTIQYSSAGVPVWTNTYDGPEHGYDLPLAVVVDGQGDLIVAGISGNANESDDAVAIKYSNAGTPLWTNRFSGPLNLHDQLWSVAVDGSDNVVVAGIADLSLDYQGTTADFLTIKYSSSGVPLWTRRYNGPSSSRDGAMAVAVDTGGNIFVSGFSHPDTALLNPDIATIKYSGDGDEVWSRHYDGGSDQAVGLRLDGAGNVFVIGTSTSIDWTSLSSEYVTLAYSNAGTILWTNRYAGPGTFNEVHALTVDLSGNVFVTGFTQAELTGPRSFATIKYLNSGKVAWTNYFDAAGRDGSPAAIALDPRGNVVVTGGVGDFPVINIVTIKYEAQAAAPILMLQRADKDLVLNWSGEGFFLQSAPSVIGPFTNILGAVSPFTYSYSEPQQFFRLKQ